MGIQARQNASKHDEQAHYSFIAVLLSCLLTFPAHLFSHNQSVHSAIISYKTRLEQGKNHPCMTTMINKKLYFWFKKKKKKKKKKKNDDHALLNHNCTIQ